MSRVRLAVIGCGAVSTLYHLPAVRQADAVELVAVVDPDLNWAEQVAGPLGVSAWPHHLMVVGHADAALVATPNHTHAAIACELLEAGVHVLCEKPLAPTRGEVARVLEAAARGPARLMAAHCLRFSPNLALLRELVGAGWFGTPLTFTGSIGGPYAQSARRTEFRRAARRAGGGVLLDLGVHLIDLAIWMAGVAPDTVAYSGSRAPDWDVETDVEVGLGFADGNRATLEATYTRASDAAFSVRGPDGWATASLYHGAALRVFSARARACRAAGALGLRTPGPDMYVAQLAHFAGALQQGAPFRVTAPEMRAVIDVVERCDDHRTARAA